MEQERKPNLEELIHRELRGLPVRRAPANLLPSVMAAVQARAAMPWYRKSWQKWPRSVQWLALAFGLLMVFGLVGSAGWAWQTWAVAPIASARQLAFSGANLALGVTEALLGALTLAAQSVRMEIWIGVGGLIAACYTACVGAGAFVYHFIKARE